MFFTKLAVLLATSLAACTKCFLATGLLALTEANLQALHKTLVCLAITVAADSTCGSHGITATPSASFQYLLLRGVGVEQTLAGHTDCLISFSKL